jgi:serine/threonine protein kinase
MSAARFAASIPSSALLTRLGQYELLRLLAQGGMADIYLARRTGGIDRYVAVKVLNAQRAADPEACALFLDEARLLAMLHHTNLGTVFEIDVEGGVHYLAMEFVHGVDLRDMLAAASRAQTGVPWAVAVSILQAAASGLDHAHRRCGPDGRPLHLVHRDVSLSNIMVGHDGSVKVIDFGIATAAVSSHHTNPGIVRGKASYMSPEQCLGDPLDLRSDVFALGVVLYELTTGRRCFPGNSDFERMVSVVRGEYARPSAVVPGYPPMLERVITTALALDPNDRYPSAAQMIEALEAAAEAYGWTGGARAIAKFMTELFGEVAEPWTGASTDRHAAVMQLPQPDPTIVITKPRRIARGTESEATVQPVHEDGPTRGRRSVPRLWAPIAA